MRLYDVVIMLLVVVVLVGCRQQVESATDSGIDIDMSLEPETPVVGEATLSITLRDEAGSPIENASIEVRGDMSHAGMMPVIRQVADGTGGEYEVPFEWTMAGDWLVEVIVTLPDGTTTTEMFEFKGVEGSP